MDETNVKSWLKSKTVWFNFLTTVLMVLSLSEVASFVPPTILALINGVGNVILRVWFTSTSLQ